MSKLKPWQRMNPHHAITAPMGIMRVEDDGEYVLFASAQERERMWVEALKAVINIADRDTDVFAHARALVAQWEREQK